MAIDVQKDIKSVYAPYTNQSILGSDYYTGEIEEDSEFDTPYGTRTGVGGFYDRFTGPIKNTFQKYGAPIVGSIMGGIMGIPGLGFLMNQIPRDPYAGNYGTLADGAYMSSTGMKDKFGYNLNSFKNNFLQPGTNSYRSYALQGLRSLDEKKANDYYEKTYGKSFDEIKSDIQDKKAPFSPGIKNPYEGTADNFGNNSNNSGDHDGGASADAQSDDAAGAGGYDKGGRVKYFFGGLATRGKK